MRTGLMAKKIGMTRVFDDNRNHNSVTVLEIPIAKVLKLRKIENDGYNALVVGFDKIKPNRLNKAQRTFLQNLKLNQSKD